MSILELIQVSYQQLVANKLRSFLTLLGIIIGVWFVITIVSVMDAYGSSLVKSTEMLSMDVFQIDSYGRDRSVPRSYYKDIKPEAADLLQKRCSKVVNAAAEMWGFGKSFKYEGRKTPENNNIAGGQVGFIRNNAYEIERGRDFMQNEIETSARVIIIGHDIEKALFFDRNPLDKYVTIDGSRFRVIGTIKEKGSSFGQSQDAVAVFPLGQYIQKYGARTAHITMRSTSFENRKEAMEQAEFEMRKIMKTQPGKVNNFRIFDNSSQSAGLESSMQMVSMIGALLGSIALLVGGVGVMNIMLASVKERTREIGIRKSIGAKKSSILFQFLFESTFLCFVGCMIGIVTGLLSGLAVTLVMGVAPVLPVGAIVVAVLMTSFIGIGFGSIPAYQASKLDPIEALRYE